MAEFDEYSQRGRTGSVSVCSPKDPGAPYRIEVAEAEAEAVEGGANKQKPVHTPLLSKELSMLTRELSMIARQGTMVSMSGRERSMMSSPTSRMRAGLVSRISILPAAFVAPPPEIDIDPISGVSVLHLSFLYKHAPSLRFYTKEVSTELVDLEDDDLYYQIEEAIKNDELLFPKCCFENVPITNSNFESHEGALEGVPVQVVSQRDISMFNKSRQNGSMQSGTARSRKISIGTKSVEETSLPLVTPRAILLTPEPSPSDEEQDQASATEEDAKTVPMAASHATIDSFPKRNQVMVCLKPIKDSSKQYKSSKQNKQSRMGSCQGAMIEDVFREILDHRGFDFLNPRTKSRELNMFLQKLNNNEDISVMMESPQWPLIAERWFKRNRSHWPSKEVIDELKTIPCHVTAFPSLDKEGNKFLKRSIYSFPLVDNILFGSLTQKQCIVFAIVSILYQKHFSEPTLLRLAHIKAVFFWACENTPADYWTDSDLAGCVCYVMNQLLEALTNSNLQHFITEENMLQCAVPETLREISDMVRLVRKTPIESLINSNHFSPYDEILCEPILTYLMRESKMQGPKDDISCIIQTALKISQSYMSEHGKEHAVSVLDDACHIIFQYRQFDEAGIALVQVTNDMFYSLCDLDRVIEYTENMAYIAYEYENEHLDLSLCLSRLATLYHCKAQDIAADSNANLDGNQSKSVWLQKCQEYFELALLEDYSLVSVLHYAMYLLKQEHALEAIEKLTSAIALTDETDETELLADTTTFTLLEVNILNDDLALDVKVMGTVKAPTVAMAYYQLCRALIAADIARGLEEYMMILEILAQSEDNMYKHTTWALLGYIKHSLKDIFGARRAFTSALEHKKNYDVLKDKLDFHKEDNTCSVSMCCQIL